MSAVVALTGEACALCMLAWGGWRSYRLCSLMEVGPESVYSEDDMWKCLSVSIYGFPVF